MKQRSYPQTKSHLLCNFARGHSYSLRKRRDCCLPSLLPRHGCLPVKQSKWSTFPNQHKSSSASAEEPTIFSFSSHSLTMADIPSILSLPKEESSYQKKKKKKNERNSGSCGERVLIWGGVPLG